jgi:hypothetical protein
MEGHQVTHPMTTPNPPEEAKANNVKRFRHYYSTWCGSECEAFSHEDPDGDWVRHEDYLSAQRAAEEARGERDKLRDCNPGSEHGSICGCCIACLMSERDAARDNSTADLADLAQARGECEWMNEEASEDGHSWGTECGHVFYLEDGDPAANSMKFCPFCGGTLVRAFHKDQEEL